MPPRKRLGQLLTELGVVDEHQLQSALGHQKQWGGKLGAILVQKGFCKEEEVVSALSRHLGMPRVKLAEQTVDPRATKFVSRMIAEKLHVFAYEVAGVGRSEVVTIAMSDPTDLSAVDQLAFHTGKRIKPMLAGDSEIVSAITEHYPMEKAPAGAPAPAAAPPAASAGPGAFPRRIDPGATPAQSTRLPPGVGIPKMTPVMTPQRAVAPPAAPIAEQAPYVPPPSDPPPPKPNPVELPDEDAEGMSLEPIAAHSQVAEVEGQAEFTGEGSAADSMEGFESAGNAQSAAQDAWTAQPAASWDAGAGWDSPDAPPAAVAVPSQEEWETPPDPLPDWGDSPQAPAEEAAPAEEQPWSAEEHTAESAAVPAEEPVAEPVAAPEEYFTEAHTMESEAAVVPAAEPEAGEELPADAILGTADEEPAAEFAGEQPAAAEAPDADRFSFAEETPAEAAPAEEAPVEETPAEQHAESAEAPDAWAESEDPLAAAAAPEPVAEEVPQWGQLNETAEPLAEEGQAAEDVPVAEEAAVVEEIPASAEAFAEESPFGEAAAPAEESPFGEAAAPVEEALPVEEAPAEEALPVEEAPAEEALPVEEAAPAEEPAPAEEAAVAEEPAPVEEPPAGIADLFAEASHESYASDEPLSPPEEVAAEVAAAEPEAAPEEPPHEEIAEHSGEPTHRLFGPPDSFGEEQPETHPDPSLADTPPDGYRVDSTEALHEEATEAPHEEEPPETSAFGMEPPASAETVHDEAAAADWTDTAPAEPAAEGLQLEGWVPPPAEPPAEGAGWLGQALHASTPISAQDVATLAAVGVDPNDGVAALRLLASLVRALDRRGLIDFDEIASEVAQNRHEAPAEPEAT